MNDLFLYFFALIAIILCWLIWEIHQKLNQISNAQLAFKRGAGLGNQSAVRELRFNSNFK
mgnify:CR=1 FL=1